MGSIRCHSSLGVMDGCYQDAVQHDGSWCSRHSFGNSFGNDVKFAVKTMRVSLSLFSFFQSWRNATWNPIVSGRMFRVTYSSWSGRESNVELISFLEGASRDENDHRPPVQMFTIDYHWLPLIRIDPMFWSLTVPKSYSQQSWINFRRQELIRQRSHQCQWPTILQEFSQRNIVNLSHLVGFNTGNLRGEISAGLHHACHSHGQWKETS